MIILPVTHNCSFRASWSMLRASSLLHISKNTPCLQESGMSLVVTATNWAVHEVADADLGDERRTTRLVELAQV